VTLFRIISFLLNPPSPPGALLFYSSGEVFYPSFFPRAAWRSFFPTVVVVSSPSGANGSPLSPTLPELLLFVLWSARHCVPLTSSLTRDIVPASFSAELQ